MTESLKAQIEQSLRLPRSLDDNDLSSEAEHRPHPGHRYLTPQPDRKKPHLPTKPADPAPRKRRSTLQGLQELAATAPPTPVARSSKAEGAIPSVRSKPEPRPRQQLPSTSSASIAKAEKNDDDDDDEEEEKTATNGHATPVRDPDVSDEVKPTRLGALRATSDMEPLKPKRKAPGKPGMGARRKSDTQLQLVEQLKRRNQSLHAEETTEHKRHAGKKVHRSASSAGILSDSSGPGHLRVTERPQFLTPQPTRRKFNLVARSPSSAGEGGSGPVARLALKNKRSLSSASPSSPSPPPPHHHNHNHHHHHHHHHASPPLPHTSPDSGHGSDASPHFPAVSPSPQLTPVSPLAAPAFAKRMASQASSDSGHHSADASPASSPSSTSPVSPASTSGSTTPATPVSPLAAPAFARQSARQAAPPVPAKALATPGAGGRKPELKGLDAMRRQWTTPEKSHQALSAEAMARHRATSTPGNIPRRVSRGGSVSKSKQRQTATRPAASRQLLAAAVASPGRLTSASSTTSSISSLTGPSALVTGGRERQRHRSAPVGRSAALVNAISLDPAVAVRGPGGEEAPLHAALTARPGLASRLPRRASDSLRKEVLRSISMERSRKMSMLSDGRGEAGIESAILTGKAGQGFDQPDSSTPPFLNGDYGNSFKRSQSRDNESIFSDYPSTFSASPNGSPVKQRPKLRRGRSSRTSLGSLKSMLASNEFLHDVFLSDRKSHRKLKGIVGALVGLILGGCLFLGVHYGLEYGLYASIVISIVGMLIMCLGLALTVRARCVAALMVPTLCTSRGRAAFLALILTLLLTGPIDNIYTNGKVASDSMSCSAELAKNQTSKIRDAAAEVFDVYVNSLIDTVSKLQMAAEEVNRAFEPVDAALSFFIEKIEDAGETLRLVATDCKETITSAYTDCSRGANEVYQTCKIEMDKLTKLGGPSLIGLCDVIQFGSGACDILRRTSGICDGPAAIDSVVNEALSHVRRTLHDFRLLFTVDVDFSTYWDARRNQSRSFASIQAAVQADLEESFGILNAAFTVVDKIVALSVLYLLFRSYQYHSQYRTRDRFDNVYVTAEFKRLDGRRKVAGRESLLPLKKSERRRLVDLSSPWLSRSERGLFKLGLVTVLLHAVVAGVLILVDHGLYWLLSLVARHGQVEFQISGGGGADLSVGGEGVVARLIQQLFSEGFRAVDSFDVSLDTDHCLPDASPPDGALSVGIGVLYLVVLLTVMSQAYALRLRRRIAAYFYPERELERIAYLYSNTLHRRQSLLKVLKVRVRQAKREQEAGQRVSLGGYLQASSPCCRRLARACGRPSRRPCLGCGDTAVPGGGRECGNPNCRGVYCRECLDELDNTCTLCKEVVAGSDLSIGVVEHRV